MGQRILAVDDEERIVRLLQIRLGALGYEVIAAHDGETALQRVAELRPDLVLLDVMMPQMDGFEVLRRLKADPETESIPVIMLTARGQFDDLAHGYGGGAHWYFHKPFEVHELERIVIDMLGLPEPAPDEFPTSAEPVSSLNGRGRSPVTL
jgi:two-component system, OmpR family, alkaline phosphatase synthesis response regulator PhoP